MKGKQEVKMKSEKIDVWEVRELSKEILLERLKQIKEKGVKGCISNSEIELLRLGLNCGK